ELNTRYKPSLGGAGQHVHLVDADGKPYDGDAPYAIINLRATDLPKLKDFKPLHASAAILEQFYSSNEPSKEAVSVLKEALTIYSDLDYQKRAFKVLDDLNTMMQDEAKNKDAIAKLKKDYEVLVKNILNEQML